MPVSVIKFSASTGGLPILISDTASAGTEFHLCSSGATETVYVWAVNKDTQPSQLSLELGGTGSPIQKWVTNQGGEILVLEGFKSFSNATSCAAFAGNANVVSIYGYVIQET